MLGCCDAPRKMKKKSMATRGLGGRRPPRLSDLMTRLLLPRSNCCLVAWLRLKVGLGTSLENLAAQKTNFPGKQKITPFPCQATKRKCRPFSWKSTKRVRLYTPAPFLANRRKGWTLFWGAYKKYPTFLPGSEKHDFFVL